MGNQTNYLQNKPFMMEYYNKEKQFKRQTPLFNVDDIQFPLSTNGMKIVDKTGRRVKLAGTNWSGGHAARHTISGLDRLPMAQLINKIKNELSMNVVRLTFSLQLFYDDNVIPEKLLSANPHLFGMTAMQIFDYTIEELTKAGLMVFLNNHTSKSQWCCSNDDGDGLWWSKQYPQDKFFACLRALTKRYKDNPRVVGMDLRNEIRKANGKTPTWGDGNKETDWRLAAETIGNQIQEIAPHWLIIIGGLQYQTDLKNVRNHPVHLNIPNKLVYSGHIYGFSWPAWVAGYWRMASYDAFYKKMFNDQLYVRNYAPFILGQFGNNTKDKYWNYLMKMLEELDIDWTYWCVDGYKCDDQEDETYGLLTKDYKYIRYPWMDQDLQKVGKPKKKGGLRLFPQQQPKAKSVMIEQRPIQPIRSTIVRDTQKSSESDMRTNQLKHEPYTYIRPENEKFVQSKHQNQEFMAHNHNTNSGRKYN